MRHLQPSSGDFYRRLAGLATAQDPIFERRLYGAPPEAAAAAPAAEQAVPRSIFACPCCTRLFHAYQDGDRYYGVVACGGAEYARVSFEPPQRP